MRLNFNIPLGVTIHGHPRHFIFGLESLVGGVMNMAGNAQKFEYDKYLKAMQSRLNREEMQHSMGLQQSQNEWMMNRQYSAQVQGLKNAGLNPAMAGGSSIGGMSGGSAHPTTGGPGSGMSGGSFDYGTTMMAIDQQAQRIENETKVADAQANALNAEADRNSKDAELKGLDIQSYDQRLQSQLHLQSAEAYNQNMQGNLYHQKEKTEIYQTEKASAEVVGAMYDNELKLQEFRTKSLEQRRTLLEMALRSKEVEANIRHLNTQDRVAMQDCITRMYTAENDAEYKDAQKALADLQADMIRKYGDPEHIAGLISQTLSAVGGIALGAAAGRFVKGGKALSKGGKALYRSVSKMFKK